MQENEMDDTQDQADDQSFYSDTFGEQITREGQDDPMMADSTRDDEAMADDSDDDMDSSDQADTDDGFRESLDDSEPMGDPATMDEPGSDFEDATATDEKPSMSDRIREKYNNLTGDDET